MDDDRFPITCFSMHRGYIRLVQHGRNTFSTYYGQQITDDLTYSQAAASLGAAIMHHAACEYLLINEADDDLPDTDQIDRP